MKLYLYVMLAAWMLSTISYMSRLLTGRFTQTPENLFYNGIIGLAFIAWTAWLASH
jgi:hypothetical protein